MDLASRLAHLRDQTPEHWVRTANRVLPPGVTAILVIVIAYQLAVLTWQLVPGTTLQSTIPTPAMPIGSETAAERPIDFTALKESHLFGEAPVAPVEPSVEAVVDAPDTTLSLRLTGITAVSEGELPGYASISGGRDEGKLYQTGQAIDNANGATLHTVYGDRVILNRGGRLETLRLPQELSSGGPVARAPGRPMGMPPATPPESAGSLRQVITENASRITDVIRVTPHVEQGQLVGFRLSPGRDRETFEALGLQPGDIVTDINGTVMDDPSRGLQVFESLGEASMANVTVLRNGVPQLIVVDTSQLQGLEENRE
jgi:general secretion pathway protein C